MPVLGHDPEKLKRVYDDLVTESGAHILFLTMLADVERDDKGNITALLLLNKGGLRAYRAAVYVDCTGDGDVAAWAGAEYHMGMKRPASFSRLPIVSFLATWMITPI